LSVKRKVAHLTSVHPASDARIAFRECATLANAGYDVVVVAAGAAPEPLPHGVRLRSVPRPRNRFERMTRTVWDVFRAALQERADLYHFHDPELIGAGIALRLLGARVVFDVHEDIPQDIADKPWIAPALRGTVALASTLVLRAIQPFYSAIVTATPTIAKRFPRSRTVVVCNYPRIEDLPSVDRDSAEQESTAIYLGSITELRCIKEMVLSMASPDAAPGVRLLLLGTFENQELERRVRALPGWDKVTYLGQRPRAEALQYLARARVGLLLFHAAANHDDCLPTKLFEYLGAGLPVIISDTMRCSDIVREHECGLVVDPRDVDAVARAIRYCVEHPLEAREMGERGRRAVMEHYQWTSEAKKLTKLYAEIA
jgi:glycosyltransferase involved in cell wall biosynthesis